MIFFFAISLILNVLGMTLGSECRTPLNKTGNCVPIATCDALLTVLRSGTLNVDQRAFLKDSECGRDTDKADMSQQILVCCEQSSEAIGLRSDVPVTATDAGNILPEAPVCGRDFRNRILGGSATEIDQFPWMALLQYKKSATDFDFHCGGSLINSRYVLTAAHCIDNPDMPKHWVLYAVRLGEYDTQSAPDCKLDALGKKDCAPLHRDILIEQILKHENYLPDSKDQFNDIGLLRLADYVTPYNDFIKPICLPFLPEFRSKDYIGSHMDVAGWGITELGETSKVKLTIRIPVWNTSECNTKYASYNLMVSDRTQLCAGGLQGIDTCRGDSGGPLMFIERVKTYDPYFQIGIVSYGPRPCGLKTWPGVYTRVSEFVDWIRSQLKP